MAENDWTSRQQDILEDLNAGNAGSLVAYLMEGGSVSNTLREAIEHRLNTGSFSWKADAGKVGRPAEDIWRSIGYLREKKMMQRVSKLRATEIEFELADRHGLSHDSFVKKLKNATRTLKYFASKEDGEWANNLLNLNKEK